MGVNLKQSELTCKVQDALIYKATNHYIKAKMHFGINPVAYHTTQQHT